MGSKMKKQCEQLSNHTWLNVGGNAEIATPESKLEFVDLLKECNEKDRSYRILGNGSNLLVSDNGVDDLVIKNTEACTEFNVDGTIVQVGASITMPQFVNKCIENDLGGYEYLYSVPGTIGGGIYMNAGRGKKHDLTISDYLVEVEIFNGEDCAVVTKEELTFSHRYSTFQDQDDWTILTATFDLPRQSREKGRKKVQNRMSHVSNRERAKPNAGSVFKSSTCLPLHKIPPNGLKIGGARFVHSKRICNDGGATFKDIKYLIMVARLLHRIVPFIDVPEIEYQIWE